MLQGMNGAGGSSGGMQGFDFGKMMQGMGRGSQGNSGYGDIYQRLMRRPSPQYEQDMSEVQFPSPRLFNW